jgi:hypothetical protein
MRQISPPSLALPHCADEHAAPPRREVAPDRPRRPGRQSPAGHALRDHLRLRRQDRHAARARLRGACPDTNRHRTHADGLRESGRGHVDALRGPASAGAERAGASSPPPDPDPGRGQSHRRATDERVVNAGLSQLAVTRLVVVTTDPPGGAEGHHPRRRRGAGGGQCVTSTKGDDVMRALTVNEMNAVNREGGFPRLQSSELELKYLSSLTR